MPMLKYPCREHSLSVYLHTVPFRSVRQQTHRLYRSLYIRGLMFQCSIAIRSWPLTSGSPPKMLAGLKQCRWLSMAWLHNATMSGSDCMGRLYNGDEVSYRLSRVSYHCLASYCMRRCKWRDLSTYTRGEESIWGTLWRRRHRCQPENARMMELIVLTISRTIIVYLGHSIRAEKRTWK